jgi:hypothetical protein
MAQFYMLVCLSCFFALSITVTNLQLLTIALASIFGSLSGYIASRVCFVDFCFLFVMNDSRIQGCLNSPSVAESFSDKKYWIVPSDFEFLSTGVKSHNDSDATQV